MLVLISDYKLHARNDTKAIDAVRRVKYRIILNSNFGIYFP